MATKKKKNARKKPVARKPKKAAPKKITKKGTLQKAPPMILPKLAPRRAGKGMGNWEAKAHGLVDKGRSRGFVTYDEILKLFPDIERDVEFLDELYSRLSTARVDILESGGRLSLGEDDW